MCITPEELAQLHASHFTQDVLSGENFTQITCIWGLGNSLSPCFWIFAVQLFPGMGWVISLADFSGSFLPHGDNCTNWGRRALSPRVCWGLTRPLHKAEVPPEQTQLDCPSAPEMLLTEISALNLCPWPFCTEKQVSGVGERTRRSRTLLQQHSSPLPRLPAWEKPDKTKNWSQALFAELWHVKIILKRLHNFWASGNSKPGGFSWIAQEDGWQLYLDDLYLSKWTGGCRMYLRTLCREQVGKKKKRRILVDESFLPPPIFTLIEDLDESVLLSSFKAIPKPSSHPLPLSSIVLLSLWRHQL